ncbi:DUF2269 domain-containing protein [Streptomyces noursei]|uniref:DUF2269 domain-containing protein n=1 Tax=Streptomyces noursei TaxID=1971 RepID=UPI001671EE02|nr:DUF2269 domain-containing protein [Streptomyces noursei]MCZ1016930.1 DUF2269 domain-containing protein [Streptomyces noursei]GGX06010.1 membrane protein [Streptomyces noursei]
MQLSRPVRRALLVVHVAVSVSWLGLTAGLLTLGLAGFTAGSAETAVAAYRAMGVLTDFLVLPVAAASLASGVALSLGTHWGLARHRWVLTKFWSTLLAVGLTLLALRPGIAGLAAAAATGRPAPDPGVLVAPAVASALYLFLTAVSVLKPWGRTRRGGRPRGARSAGNRERAGAPS